MNAVETAVFQAIIAELETQEREGRLKVNATILGQRLAALVALSGRCEVKEKAR